MKCFTVKIKYYNPSQNKKTSKREALIIGQFYELFCYNRIIKTNRNIDIIKANFIKEDSNGNFNYSNDKKIVYRSNGVTLAEFDVLGIKDGEIYWWEISRGNRIEKERIRRKLFLMDKVFKNNKVNLTLIVPKEIKGLMKYNYQIIQEPDYSPYFHQKYFRLTNKVKHCISIEALNKLATDYNYIDDIITSSNEYFNNNFEIIEKIKLNYLITRLYNINKIKEGKFDYYDFRKNKTGYIELIYDDIYVDGKKVRKYVKTKHEVKMILDRL